MSRSSYLPFTGEVDAGWITSTGANDKLNPPENGSVGFYTVADGQADNGKD